MMNYIKACKSKDGVTNRRPFLVEYELKNDEKCTMNVELKLLMKPLTGFLVIDVLIVNIQGNNVVSGGF